MCALLKISGKPVEKSPFTYVQSIFVVEKDAVTELMIYSYNDERIFARRLNGIRTSIAGMMDFTIADITLKCKGDPSRYRTIGEKQTIERAEP